MSDSDAAEPPSDAIISRTLRDTVISIYASGNVDDLTVKRVRTRAEQELGLSAGFLKTHSQWKQKSHDQIHAAVEKYCAEEAPPASEPLKAPTPKAAPKPASKRTKATSDSPRGTKRKAPAQPKKTPKKRKTLVSSDADSDAEPPARDPSVSDSELEAPKRALQRRKKVVTEDSEDEAEGAPNRAMSKVGLQDGAGDAKVTSKAPKEDAPATLATECKVDVSESELSSLIDESPVRKKRQKKDPKEKQGKAEGKKAAKIKAGKPRVKAPTTQRAKDDDPEQAEIKRLQGWLVKCGIRKVWSKELARYETPKEKIKHLKVMLKDAGMDGKYSNEKAARIKEQREFAKDLEEIQQGERLWGQVDEPAGGGRPTRRAAARAPKKPVVEPPSGDDDSNAEILKGESHSETDVDSEDQGKGVDSQSDDASEDDSE